MGGNVPGKKREVVTFLAGVEEYERVCLERINSDLDRQGKEKARGLGGFMVDFGSGSDERCSDGHHRGDGGREGLGGEEVNGYEKGLNDVVKGREKRSSVYGLSGMFKRWGVGRS